VIPITSWRQQESEKQLRARDANESTAQTFAATPVGHNVDSFMCECGDRCCTRVIGLTLEEYASVRAYATHFAISRDHENPESERVITESERFTVIETVSPEATKLARRSDPRWGHEQLTGPLPDQRRGSLTARGRVPPAHEGTTRGRKPGRASDLTSVEKRRRSRRWLP
jgi:hypothetical protein